jgi:hypothetical protein
MRCIAMCRRMTEGWKLAARLRPMMEWQHDIQDHKDPAGAVHIGDRGVGRLPKAVLKDLGGCGASSKTIHT